MTRELQITQIQTLLNLGGHALTVDGIWGKKTQAAWDHVFGTADTFDMRTERNLATLQPGRICDTMRGLVRVAKKLAAEMGVEVKVISGTRTPERQDALYAIGRTKPGRKVTNARAWESNHNFGVAIDFGVFHGGKYLDDLGPTTSRQFYAELNRRKPSPLIEWGGDWESFTDPPHFQFQTGLSKREMRHRIEAGEALA